MTSFIRFLLPFGVLLVLGTLASCAPGTGLPSAEGWRLEEVVARGEYEIGVVPSHGVSLAGEPSLRPVRADHERRPAVITAAGALRWSGTVPTAARLRAGATLAHGRGGLEVTAILVDGRRRHVLATDRSAGPMRSWVDLDLDLGPWRGRHVQVEVVARPARPKLPVAWAPVSLVGEPRPAEQPNVLFILVDTLRYDRLSCYGYSRPTTPHIDRLLADRGVLVEEAYAQAPWTLPSVVSMMTGRYPGEVLPRDMAGFAIPPEIPSMAQVFADLGYQTAAFYANPALHAGNGFGRGFETFFAPPASFEWFQRHADELNRRALPWLAAHQDRPFFLYVHYLDPHDPYDNPDIVDGRSPFYPDYEGYLTGNDVHGVYAGAHPLRDPETDVAHLSALYDSEVRYVDRFVGQLLEALDPEVLADTLVVLTSDHGEELYDHGGWKHGQSLYEEQIHVPLLLRLDGRLPAGRRVSGTAELVDLLPTLVSAVGGEADPAWQGDDLWSALQTAESLPRRPAFAQHLSAGPLRAASVLDGRKLMLFNRREPFAPPDPLQAYLWNKDLERFPGAEVFDLRSDPQEQDGVAVDLAEPAPLVADLTTTVHRRLDRRLAGLRVLVSGLEDGRRVRGTLRLASPPEGWDPYFLGPDDRVGVTGTTVTFELAATGGALADRGFLVRGDFPPGAPVVLGLEAAVDGESLGAEALRVGAGAAYDGGTLDRAALRAAWPATSGEPRVHLWLPERVAPPTAGGDVEETRRRLQALGYL